MLKTILVDDEPNAIENLQLDLEPFSKNIHIIATFNDPIAAIDYMNTTHFDLLFLDIEMPEIDGFGLLQQIKHTHFDVVITTAYSNYAIKAFKHNAIDYLLKPIDTNELAICIAKIHAKTSKQHNVEALLQSLNTIASQKKIIFKHNGQLLFYEQDDISHVISDGNYSFIHFCNGKKLHITKKLKEVETLLFPEYYMRVHNSYIVNLNRIKSYIYTDNYIVLKDERKVPVSKSYKEVLLEKIKCF
jgi:two-component system LytT family response regulator